MSWIITPEEKTPLDQDYRNVSLLLHGDGANGSTTIVDSSPSPKTVTASGNTQISTAESKFGGASFSFPGNGLLSAPNVTDLALLNADFTIEMWCYFNTTSNEFLFWNCNSGAWGGLRLIQVSSTSLNVLASTTGGAHTTNETATNALALNTWQHIAASRSGSTLRVFVDGVVRITTTISSALNNGGINNIGGRSAFPAFMNGYIDDFRITKGVARYTANFTPPTAPFPDAGPAQ